MALGASEQLPCGCAVETFRDFLGRGLGKIRTRGEQCPHAQHEVGYVVILPGRTNARVE